MSIITPIDFKGERVIGQVENATVRANVQWFIDKYEPDFLKKLLGLTLYQEFITGLTPVPVEPPTIPPTYEPIDPKWLSLRDETDLKQMLIDYVYYWYQRNNATNTGGVGEVKPKADNANSVSPAQKMVTAWNEMAEMARLFDLDTATYPNWHRVYWRNWFFGCNWHLPEIYRNINTMNI